MKICVPSSNRAQTCKTALTLKNSIFFVPNNQYEEYKENIKNEIIPVPLKYSGITKTRNFILKYFKNENILFIDDDVRQCGFYTKGSMISLKNNCDEIWEGIFKKHFELTKDLGFKIWGGESATTNFANHPLQPFSFKGVITCNMLGIINDGSFYFDEQFEVKEDYDLVLRHFKKHGGHLKSRQFYWANLHWDNIGGCVEYRTDEMEEKAIDLLKKRFPLMIKKPIRSKTKHTISISWV